MSLCCFNLMMTEYTVGIESVMHFHVPFSNGWNSQTDCLIAILDILGIVVSSALTDIPIFITDHTQFYICMNEKQHPSRALVQMNKLNSEFKDSSLPRQIIAMEENRKWPQSYGFMFLSRVMWLLSIKILTW